MMGAGGGWGQGVGMMSGQGECRVCRPQADTDARAGAQERRPSFAERVRGAGSGGGDKRRPTDGAVKAFGTKIPPPAPKKAARPIHEECQRAASDVNQSGYSRVPSFLYRGAYSLPLKPSHFNPSP
jgi:hypothetical protein